MKLHIALLASLMMPISTFAADAADTQLFPFKLGTDQFDPEITKWWSGLMGNLKIAAQKDDSDWAKWTLARTEVPLADVAKNKEILTKAQHYYAQIQQNPLVQLTFQAMINAAQIHKDLKAHFDATPEIDMPADTPTLNEVLKKVLDQRKLAGQTFRKTAAQQLAALTKTQLPLVQEPTPGSARALDEFIERNRDLHLTDEQQQWYEAGNLVLYTFRQNHRLVDPETDGANLLLHKQVTDKQS